MVIHIHFFNFDLASVKTKLEGMTELEVMEELNRAQN